jgi:hypothetical protein
MTVLQRPHAGQRGGREAHEELVNIYDDDGHVIASATRRQAKRSGRAVGAVNALVIDLRGRVLLQRRPADKENGGRWDKSVGGHVSAGESFDRTIVREACEELFDDPHTGCVCLARDARSFDAQRARLDLARHVLLRPAGRRLALRDVRTLPQGGLRNVLYHVGMYLGVTGLALRAFRPQASELDGLRYFTPAQVDRLLLAGELAPNMAFLWLALGHALLRLAQDVRGGERP